MIDPTSDSATSGSGASPTALPSAPSYAIPAVLNGYQWGSPGSPVTVTFSFLNSVPSYYPSNAQERVNFTPLNAAQKQAAYDAFAYYASVANIRFQEVAAGSGTINIGNADLGAGIGGWAYYPHNTFGSVQPGDVWITNRFASYNNPQPGSHAYLTYVHEVGHAIGLKHPGNYNAGGGGTDGPYLPANEDSSQYTVMSYYNGPTYGSVEPSAPQLYDIAR